MSNPRSPDTTLKEKNESDHNLESWAPQGRPLLEPLMPCHIITHMNEYYLEIPGLKFSGMAMAYGEVEPTSKGIH